MITFIKNNTHRVVQHFRHRRMYVIADAQDNSVTISKALFKHMKVMKQDEAKVMVFRAGDNYCFTLNPTIEQPTQLADIQYNSKYRCIGFECLVPTVNRIFYDYGLPANSRVKISVDVLRSVKGFTYYSLCRPNHDNNNAKKHKEA